MTLKEFQTAINERWPDNDHREWMYPALGLAGETGEVIEELKKSMRPGASIDMARLNRIALELGDVLHYVARLSTVLGLTLERIAESNLQKTGPGTRHWKVG